MATGLTSAISFQNMFVAGVNHDSYYVHTSCLCVEGVWHDVEALPLAITFEIFILISEMRTDEKLWLKAYRIRHYRMVNDTI